MGVWPQFKSALPWDAAAITTYFTVSLLFWYLGLIPDLAAAARPRADPAAAHRLRHLRPRLARLGARPGALPDRLPAAGRPGHAAGAVGALHRVSCDFAISLSCRAGTRPSSRPTSWPAPSSRGFAMVLTLIIPARAVFRLRQRHHRAAPRELAKLLLVTGLSSPTATSSSSSSPGTRAIPSRSTYFVARPLGPVRAVVLARCVCNVLVPQLFWSQAAAHQRAGCCWSRRSSSTSACGPSASCIIVQSLQREFLPSSGPATRPPGSTRHPGRHHLLLHASCSSCSCASCRSSRWPRSRSSSASSAEDHEREPSTARAEPGAAAAMAEPPAAARAESTCADGRPAAAEFETRRGPARPRSAARARLPPARGLTPYPLPGLDEALGLRRPAWPGACCAVGMLGGRRRLLPAVVLNGRLPIRSTWAAAPHHSPLAFIPITFEMGVLFASLHRLLRRARSRAAACGCATRSSRSTRASSAPPSTASGSRRRCDDPRFDRDHDPRAAGRAGRATGRDSGA